MPYHKQRSFLHFSTHEKNSLCLHVFLLLPPVVFIIIVCACSTCHVIFEDEELFDSLPEPSEDEEDMLGEF